MYELQIILTLLALLGLAVAAVGFPGIFLILASLIIFDIYSESVQIAPYIYVLFAIVTIFSLFIDNIATFVGAKKFGSSGKGIWGAIIGSIIGLIVFFPLGAIIGSFIGVFVVEFYLNRDWEKSLKMSFGTLVGYLGGIVLKFIMTLVLFVWLMFIVW